jgi:hypothetical protein
MPEQKLKTIIIKLFGALPTLRLIMPTYLI